MTGMIAAVLISIQQRLRKELIARRWFAVQLEDITPGTFDFSQKDQANSPPCARLTRFRKKKYLFTIDSAM